MGVWQSVRQQVGSIAKGAAQAIAQEPVEIVKNAVGAQDTGDRENQALSALEQGQQSAQPATDDTTQHKGFQSANDYQRYQQLSGNKDQMELNMVRRALQREYGLDTALESGMQKARMEYEKKESERTKVDEQKKEERKMIVEQKKKEDMAVVAAKQASSAENRAWGAG